MTVSMSKILGDLDQWMACMMFGALLLDERREDIALKGFLCLSESISFSRQASEDVSKGKLTVVCRIAISQD